MCRKNRGRHCFVYRTPPIVSQRPIADCPAVSQRRRATSRCCSSTDVSRCPSPEPSNDCCCPPPQRTCCYPGSFRKQRPQRPRCPVTQIAPKLPKPQPKCYPGPSGQAATFAPMDESIEDPIDPYYNCNQQNHPLANFDLNRFHRDNTGGFGRRRNVSIRTCVEYDYEPQMAPPRAYSPRPNFRHPSPCTYPEFIPTQRNLYPEGGPYDWEDNEDGSSTASRYVPCRYRR
ncbi:hypothetical protein ACLKA6_004487 [Drosophila palustris]